jgi:hypothetical protein
MNTANLQLEGLYMAFAALVELGKEKGLFSTDEVDAALARAETSASEDRQDLPPANLEAIRFPIRLLRLANRSSIGGNSIAFSRLARRVGEAKDAQPALSEGEMLKLATILERESDA